MEEMKGPRLAPRKGKGGRWFVDRQGSVSFETREEAEAYIASQSAPGGVRSSANRFVVIAIVAAIVVGVGFYFIPGGTTDPKACGDETMAYVMSQKAVSRQLKAPGSAEFPLMPDAKVVRTDTCKFAVSAYVDAQNSFGAKVRSYYSADMEYSPDSRTWRATDVRIDR
ncbi:hypothetical protein [Bordetella sp. BOR01]|uniref:hypothetical protein n=1 Tax=Bordetella sp. BOR01 TaxID=2854779 RepID=UPI001C4382E5|nr:hypothetical protein [Bordetella sp. BOR01]MBV7482493.1 hypothetical protein [Bordetella sp. BOR01]